MVKRQRIAKWFLYLACLIMLTCITQRMASLHALQMVVGMQAISIAAPVDDDSVEAPANTSCELSAKSLLAAQPVMFEASLLGGGLLLVLLAPTIAARLRIPPPRVFSPPTLRVHLRLCVFRE